MNYALMENGIVTNVIVLHPMNADDFPNAVRVDGYAVRVGDTYVDGLFYRDGEQVKSNAEIAAEEREDMQAALEMLGVTVDE